ncbi:UNVERIFIED_CONTAM: Transmembrane protein 65 [Gekko kuhli]
MSTWLSCRLPLLLGPAGSAAWAARLGLQQTPTPRRPLSGTGCCCLVLRRPRRPGLWGSSRALGTHPKKEPMEALNTAQGARDFIYSLHATERSCLLRELHRFESIAIAQGAIPKLIAVTVTGDLANAFVAPRIW